MKTRFAIAAALSTLLFTSLANAATFIVEEVFDDSFAHDANPGDGICGDSDTVCTLRAAVEESNALPGADTISFRSTFANAIVVLRASEGALPPITDTVYISGLSISGYNATATRLADAPPQFFIDGSNLSGSDKRGLYFSGAGATGSVVKAIGIVNFSGQGILATAGADNLVIQRNYIGVRADGSAAGNSSDGMRAVNSSGHIIGQQRNAANTAFLSLGNVFSSNGGHGISLTNSNNNELRGNLVGIAPSGTGDRGNGYLVLPGNRGISIGGDNNIVGDYLDSASSGNFIAANLGGGMSVAGNNNQINANTLGLGEIGDFMASALDGIVVNGNANTIGNAGLGGNRIFEHAGSAIRIGIVGQGSADSNQVINNQIGSPGSITPSLFSGNGAGIYVANGDSNAILDNVIVNSQGNAALSLFGDGIHVLGGNNTILGNQVGFAVGPEGPVAEPNQQGIHVVGSNNVVGASNRRNQVGGNLNFGIWASGNQNSVRFNHVGVTSDFDAIGNASFGVIVDSGDNVSVQNNTIGDNSIGLVLAGITNSPNIIGNTIGISPNGDNIGNVSDGVRIQGFSNNVDLQQNRISYNGGNGISTDTNINLNGIAWFQNFMHSNGGIGIDLGENGVTPNDPGDVDEGPNRYQNFPVIEQAMLDTQTFPPTLTISYRVDSNSGASAYPFFVDFYWSDMDEGAQGRFFLGTDFSYTTPNALRTVVFNFIDGVPGGWLTATALDQDRNTSELAARFEFGDPFNRIFADGFE